MLAAVSADVAADLRVSRLEDPLPEGNFGVRDQPSTIDDQLRWLAAAGLDAEVWARQDLA
jgi:hypothetical protein